MRDFPLVIGLSGVIGSGKDTTAELFVKHFSNCCHVKFAHALQDIVSLMIGTYSSTLSHREMFDDREWKNNTVVFDCNGVYYTPRKLMQKVGSDFRNNFGKNFWVDRLADALIRQKDYYDYFVISDLRYDNEAEFVNNIGGSLIYIVSNTVNTETHESESYQNQLKREADFIIDNVASLAFLEDQVIELVNILKTA